LEKTKNLAFSTNGSLWPTTDQSIFYVRFGVGKNRMAIPKIKPKKMLRDQSNSWCDVTEQMSPPIPLPMNPQKKCDIGRLMIFILLKFKEIRRLKALG
jgi:hypothetical protein